LLDAARKQCATVALLDRRLEVPEDLGRGIRIIRVLPTLTGRLLGEQALRKLAGDADQVLCFGNLPPLFWIKGRVTVFLQNRFLVDRSVLEGFPTRMKWRIRLERLWLRYCQTHADFFVVQTQSMQEVVRKVVGQTVLIAAFSPDGASVPGKRPSEPAHQTATYDFVYAATGEPHKNHRKLLDAWKLLAFEGLYPSLCLTVSKSDYPVLADLIEREKADHKLRIDNVPARSRSDMQRLYGCSQALVYPSLTESFGLPLIEAQQAGLSIIAAELDYVRDLVNPKEVFDPRSSRSIARAVKRFLHMPEPLLPVLSTEAFVQRLLAV
jgi:glycosyltransferase involved in cell wall biosynthesis